MAFTHKVTGKPGHTHETVAEAKECESPAPKLYAAVIGGKHSANCECDVYNRCAEFRRSTARNMRDLFRAYND